MQFQWNCLDVVGSNIDPNRVKIKDIKHFIHIAAMHDIVWNVGNALAPNSCNFWNLHNFTKVEIIYIFFCSWIYFDKLRYFMLMF